MRSFIKIVVLIFVSTLWSVSILSAQCTAAIGLIDVVQVAGDTIPGCDPLNLLLKEKTTGGGLNKIVEFW